MAKIIKTKIIILILILPSVILAQTAEEAYKELRKVQARVQVGVSYKDYPAVLAPAKYAVNMYLKSEEVKKNPELAKAIKSAMRYYEFALDFWKHKFPEYEKTKDFVLKGSLGWTEMEIFFPEAIKPREEGGVVYKMKFGGKEVIFISDGLSFIWNKASKKLDEIDNLMKK